MIKQAFTTAHSLTFQIDGGETDDDGKIWQAYRVVLATVDITQKTLDNNFGCPTNELDDTIERGSKDEGQDMVTERSEVSRDEQAVAEPGLEMDVVPLGGKQTIEADQSAEDNMV